MRNKLIMGICISALVCTIGAGTALAAGQAFGRWGKGSVEMTDEQKTEMEAMRTEREDKISEFLAGLNSEQLALYEAANPDRSKDEPTRERPDEAAMAQMQESREAFLASLTEDQKTAYAEILGKRNGRFGNLPDGEKPEKPERMEMTDEQKAEMDTMRAEREEKLNAFVAGLSDNQLALYEAATPDRSKGMEKQEKPDEATMIKMQENREAFLASLSEDQLAVYEEIFKNAGHGGMRSKPDRPAAE